MKRKETKEAWEDEWSTSETIGDSASPIGKILRKWRLDITGKMLSPISSNIKAIDMGCGGGTTLLLLREHGFNDSIGIDFSKAALKKCENKGLVVGKDVFHMNASKTTYQDKEFGLVFEEGLWEHFEDPAPFIDEACRICGEWMLITQPDHYTFFGWLLHWLWMRIGTGGVFEYSFTMEYFIDHIEKNGFKLFDRRSTFFKEQAIILFRRVSR